MQHVRKPNARPSPTVRAKRSNRPGTLHGVDNRAPMSRRYRDLVLAYVAQFEITSDGDMLRVETAAGLKLSLEERTVAMCRGERVDHAELGRLSYELRKVLDELKREPEDRAPINDTVPGSLSAVLCGSDDDEDDD